MATFYALFAHDARGRRSSPTSATTSPAGWPALRRPAPTSSARSGRPASRHATGGSTWHRSPCLGLCERAPAALFTVAGDRAPERSRPPRSTRSAWCGGSRRTSAPTARPTGPSRHAAPTPERSDRRSRRPATRGPPPARPRVGRVDPTSLDDYRASRRLRGARPGRSRWAARRSIAEVTASKLLGRGGAAFPTGRKWERRRPASPLSRTTSSATPTSRSPARSRTAS